MFDFFSWEEFCEDVTIEKAGFYMDSPVPKSNRLPGVLTGDTQEMTSEHSESMSLSILSMHRDEAQSIMRPCKKLAWYFSSSITLLYLLFLYRVQ